MRVSLSIKKNILQDQSNPKTHARSRWFFSKNSWGKPISISKWLVPPCSGRPILCFGKCPMIAPTPIPFQNFHFNLFQPVKMNQGDLKQMVLQLYQPLCEIRKINTNCESNRRVQWWEIRYHKVVSTAVKRCEVSLIRWAPVWACGKPYEFKPLLEKYWGESAAFVMTFANS